MIIVVVKSVDFTVVLFLHEFEVAVHEHGKFHESLRAIFTLTKNCVRGKRQGFFECTNRLTI